MWRAVVAGRTKGQHRRIRCGRATNEVQCAGACAVVSAAFWNRCGARSLVAAGQCAAPQSAAVPEVALMVSAAPSVWVCATQPPRLSSSWLHACASLVQQWRRQIRHPMTSAAPRTRAPASSRWSPAPRRRPLLRRPCRHCRHCHQHRHRLAATWTVGAVRQRIWIWIWREFAAQWHRGGCRCTHCPPHRRSGMAPASVVARRRVHACVWPSLVPWQ